MDGNPANRRYWVNFYEINQEARIKRNNILNTFRRKTKKLIFAQRFINNTLQQLSSKIRIIANPGINPTRHIFIISFSTS